MPSPVTTSTSPTTAFTAMTQGPWRLCPAWLTRALFPRVMEFKVISREREKHEFMPVVYLLSRSEAWRRRVPRAIEERLLAEYIAPLYPRAAGDLSDDDLVGIAAAVAQRAELLTRRKRPCTDEAAYKLGLVVDFDPEPSLQKSELFRVVRSILGALSAASHQRALLVPVSLHFCADETPIWGPCVRRYAGIRYGAPVLVEPRDVAIFREDPLEFVQHTRAKLVSSLKMQPPQTAAQMEILRLSRSLHVYCAKVSRDDCFSRRQLASMNEEILQIHFRTRSHPDMHALKVRMQDYCRRLHRWRLRDEDINAATIAATHPRNALQVANVLATIATCCVSVPGRLILSGAGDVLYRSPQRKVQEALSVVSMLVKCTAAMVLVGILTRVLYTMSSSNVALVGLLVLLLLHAWAVSLGYEDVYSHWKKIQFYFMDASELDELKAMRAVLARRIHAIVAQYVSTDMPPPVVEDRAKHTEAPEDAYSLNPHHKIFINAPRSFPLAFATDVDDQVLARRAVYAPKMLRDEMWRRIYGALAPKEQQFAALLADNKGDSLPMERLLQSPVFDAVLTAYVIHEKRSNRSQTDSENEASNTNFPGDCRPAGGMSESSALERYDLGAYKTKAEVVQAALELAVEEEELSS